MSHSIPEAISITSGNIPKNTPHFSGRMELSGLPLNGDSELLKYMDNRMALMGSIALIQVMQAHTGAGVNDHSDVYDDTISRLVGSTQMITASAFDGENGDKIAQFITAQHRPINGTDHTGKRYSALNPESWSETFDTFFYAPEQIFLRYDSRSKNPRQRQEVLEQMYLEFITWYQRFGITDKYVAPNYDAFREKWQNMVENKLVMTDAARWGFDLLKNNKFPFPTVIPELARKAMNLPLAPPAHVYGKILMSGMPPEVLNNKEFKKDLPSYNFADKLMVRGIESSVKRGWPVLPASVRYVTSDLEFLQRHGKYNGVTDRIATLGWGATKRVISTQTAVVRGAKSLLGV